MCGLGIQRPFSSSPSPSLESSILSWKAACSLFRYHLHINAASRLAGRHLMQRWQHPRYLSSPTITFRLIFSPLLHYKICPRHCSEWLTNSPGTSDRSTEVTVVLGHGSLGHGPIPRTVILSIPREDVLGCQSPLTRNIGPGPSSHIAGTQGKIGPHIYYLYSI